MHAVAHELEGVFASGSSACRYLMAYRPARRSAANRLHIADHLITRPLVERHPCGEFSIETKCPRISAFFLRPAC